MSSYSFESQFLGAFRRRYDHEPLRIEHAVVVTDLPPDRADAVRDTVVAFLSRAPALQDARWTVISEDDLPRLGDLLERAVAEAWGLIVTYRNLGERERHPRSSLGAWVDNLTQAVAVPVLLLPARRDDDVGARSIVARLKNTDRVLIVTDHLTDDPQLVRYGAELTEPGGTLLLTHIEEQATFERYMDIISKIPEIDNDVARRTIGARLLKEPADFCEEVANRLGEAGLSIKVSPEVRMGHALPVYRELLDGHEVDLVVADAKDPEREAMSPLTYSLAVELIDVPMLLL